MARIKSTAAPHDGEDVEEAVGAEIPVEAPCHEERADSLSINNGPGSGDGSEAGLQDGGDPEADAEEISRSYYFGSSIVVFLR
jgi:hypothetical protein